MSTDYRPITAVWEITMGCNLRCMHCGSACEGALPGELTTEEAMAACDSMGRMGLKWVTLSGGEPLTRRDWPEIASRLRRNGVVPNMISNGWLIAGETPRRIREAGIGTMAISLDGLERTHDAIRKQGSFQRTAKAFTLLKDEGVYTGAITTLNRMNLPELPQMRQLLESLGVDSWQLQIGIPMGSMTAHQDLLLDNEDVRGILGFCLETALRGRLKVFPADCLGYFSPEEEITRQLATGAAERVRWEGCNAGKRSFGLLHDGDVIGCTSIRDRTLIEGNIKQRPLERIWNDASAFGWARRMKREHLEGECRSCRHGDVCLGGCPNSRLTINGSMRSESPWCVYSDSLRRTREHLRANYADGRELLARARAYCDESELQLALLVLDRAAEILGPDVEVLALQGFVHFQMGHFDLCKEKNERILVGAPGNAYAMNGLGMALCRLGDPRGGIALMEDAVARGGSELPDAGRDLAAMKAQYF